MDLLPPHLLAAIAQMQASGPPTTAEEDYQRKRLSRQHLDAMVAAFILESCDPGSDEWGPETLRPQDVALLDERDIDALEDVVLRLKSPQEVTAASTGQPQPEGESVPALKDFREGAAGSGAGDDGGPLEEEAIPPDGSPG